MKKKLLSIFLSLAMVITMMPAMTMTAFADGESYVITNGTPESAQETNHGYITIDKTTAAEGDTVTVTVNPATGYQLKSLTATSAAPTEYNVTFDLNGISGTAPTAQTIEKDGKVSKPEDPADTVHTFAGWYKTKDVTTGALSDPWDFDNDTVTADMTLYAQWTRTLESIYTNSDIPKVTDNTAPDDAWVNSDGGKAFIAYSTGNTLLYLYKKLEPSGAKQLSCIKTEKFTKIGDDYVLFYELSGKQYGVFTLHMTDGKFTSVTYDGAGTNYEELSGTYSAPAAPTIRTIADVLKTAEVCFPTSSENAWKDVLAIKICYNSDDKLHLNNLIKGSFELPLEEEVSGSGGGFICLYGDVTFTFNMTEGKLTSIVVVGSESGSVDGTYAPAAATYTVTFEPVKSGDVETGEVHNASGQKEIQITVASGTEYSVLGNTITIGGTKYTAEPNSGYEFNKFAIDSDKISSGTITANTTITVHFSELQP